MTLAVFQRLSPKRSAGSARRLAVPNALYGNAKQAVRKSEQLSEGNRVMRLSVVFYTDRWFPKRLDAF